MNPPRESASYQRDLLVERAYRRGFQHGTTQALTHVLMGMDHAAMRRWVEAVEAWRNAPSQDLLPPTPPPDLEQEGTEP